MKMPWDPISIILVIFVGAAGVCFEAMVLALIILMWLQVLR